MPCHACFNNYMGKETKPETNSKSLKHCLLEIRNNFFVPSKIKISNAIL